MNLKYMFQQFSDIVEPPRGGVRGGQDQFSWETVRMDKDRENYLGHSIKAPVGRSQGGPDFMWWNKQKVKREKKEKEEMSLERKKVIELERQAMAKALGVAAIIPPTIPAKKIITNKDNIEKTEKTKKVDGKAVEKKVQKIEKKKLINERSRSRSHEKRDSKRSKRSVERKREKSDDRKTNKFQKIEKYDKYKSDYKTHR